MRRNSLLCIAIGALIAVGASAQESNDDAKYKLVNLLDASKPLAERQEVFAHYKERALEGQTFEQYVVGSLYRSGVQLPGNIVERDLDTARRYISTAAAHGYVNAMAKMAEIELADHHPLETMIWAQLYLHYTEEKNASQSNVDANRGYKADLLRRAFEVFDRKDQALMTQHLNAFVAAHDEDIRAGIKKGSTGSSKMMEKITRLSYDSMTAKFTGRRNDDLAEYLVAFAPDGTAADAWMLDAMPDVALGKELRVIAMRMRVNEIAGTEIRYGVLPLQYSFGRYEIGHPKK